MRDKASNDFSRRNFLKGAALGATGAAMAGMFGGCADEKRDVESVDTSTFVATTEEKREVENFELYETDLLIVGTGNSALAAAWQAVRANVRVTMVDKSQYRHGGPSNWSWGCYSQRNFPTELEDLSGFLVHMPLWKNAKEYWEGLYNQEIINQPAYQINHGQVMVGRDESGAIVPLNPKSPNFYSEQFFRRETDFLKTKQNLSVIDNTMITDFIINDGVCLGAMGIHIPTGKFRVIRAKATVMAAGSTQWLYGWLNTKSVSLGGTEGSGDCLAACYRHGLGISDNEWGKYDFSSFFPRMAFSINAGADFAQAVNVLDKNGDHIFEADKPPANAAEMALGIAQAVLDGRGSENGGVFLLIGDTHDGKFYWEYKNEFQKKYFDVDFRTESVEVIAEQFERLGGAVVDENMMTEVKGLFDTRGSGFFNCRPDAASSVLIRVYGAYGGHVASEYAQNTDYPADMDWKPIIEECKRLNALRTASFEGGIRPHVIRENIQKTCYSSDGIIRTTEMLENAIAEYERIREEDLPQLSLSDHALNWNKEWKDAIELHNMLDVAEMNARSTLFREESRFQYVRPEFPEKNDEKWKCFVVCRSVDGTMELSKMDVPKL